MSEDRYWEAFHLQSLEIESLFEKKAISPSELVMYWQGLSELLPADTDPADNFELYVLKKFSQSVGKCLEQTISCLENTNST